MANFWSMHTSQLPATGLLEKKPRNPIPKGQQRLVLVCRIVTRIETIHTSVYRKAGTLLTSDANLDWRTK
jgi:hypothetical protein